MLRKLARYSAKGTAHVLWHGFQAINRRIPSKTFQPKWAPEPLLKSSERTKPTLGFPRTTDSLCPTCVKEVRTKIIAGEMSVEDLVNQNPGEIKADIIERNGEIWMVKDCPKHGRTEDIMSIDKDFMLRIEEQFPGRDFRNASDGLHKHGSSSVKYGRGAVLTVDLTNRCNMMCDPCFMDANQVGYVHELTWDDVKEILDNSMKVKPQRQLSVQFSGGEPTISPHFLRAVAYSRELGYLSVQAASNGIRFAQDPEFAMAAGKAGLRLVYLQFDGVGEEANQHRKVGNLYEVKQKAIDNLHAAGVDVTLVTTVVNSVNNDQVGPIINFLIENIEKVNALSFQPVSFTGRDEEIDDETRKRQRYTISHLAHDVKKQTGLMEPMRDWFPLSASGPFSDLKDLLAGPMADWGALKCGCHPNCGSGSLVLINRETKQAVPMTALIRTDRLLRDLTVVTDAARGKVWSTIQAVLAFTRHIQPGEFPKNLSIRQVITAIDGYQSGQLGFAEKGRYEWRPAMVAAMWFQDLFNYDFRRTEMCIIPYGTQQGEISFCAYNTGIGWRQIIENMHMTATTADWFKKVGKHKVYAGGNSVPLPDGAPLPASPAASGCGSSNAAMPRRPQVPSAAARTRLLQIES